MQKPKVDVLVVLFAYSGNGGIPGTIPEIAMWLAANVHAMKNDPRIGRVGTLTLCDTPITMTRNRAVAAAEAGEFDMLLMLDSDNEPDGYLGRDPNAKPFWEVGFNFAYDRLLQDKPTLIFAPYCGPPPHPVGKPGVIDHGEVPYLFQWTSNESDNPYAGFKLDILTRREAALMRGIHPVAAGPTGVFLMTLNSVQGMKRPLFDYQMNADGSEKQTTEDVYFTRNCSLYWQQKLGENVCFAACDSWALHHKVKKVGRPVLIGVEQVGADLVQAVHDNVSLSDELRHIDIPQPPARGQTMPELFDDDEPEEPTRLAPSNGHTNGRPVIYRTVYGRRLAINGESEPSPADMDALNMIGEWIAKQAKLNPVRVLVVDPGAGASIAALLPALPTGSTIYASPGSDLLAGNFPAEVQSGRIRFAPELPADPQGFDLIVAAEGLVPGLLNDLKGHLAPKGLFAGSQHDQPETFGEIAEALDPRGWSPRVVDGSNVWMIEAAQFTEDAREPANS